MVSADAVDMPMRQFLGSRIPCLHHFDIEDQRLACQGMIGIDIGGVPAGLGHCDCAHPVTGAELRHSTRA